MRVLTIRTAFAEAYAGIARVQANGRPCRGSRWQRTHTRALTCLRRAYNGDQTFYSIRTVYAMAYTG